MNLKFLPLGSVCLVDNSDLKLVVIGYKSNGHDYVAVDYPTGYESAGSLRYFNHDEVKELYSFGYKDENGKNHFTSLNDDTMNAVSSELSVDSFKFDDMEIVISDDNITPVAEEKNNSDFFFDDNGVAVVSATVPGEDIQENNFSLEENEVSTEDLTVPVVSPVNNYQFEENEAVVEDLITPVVSPVNNYQFEENEVVVEDLITPVVIPVNNYQFEENGVVAGDLTESEEKAPENKFRFDENGIVVEDLTAPIVPSVNNFQFDENGVVIADMTASITDDIQTSQEEKTNMPVADSSDLNDEWTISLDSDLQSIFDNIETPGIVEESKEEVVFEEKVEEETSNLDIPSSEVATVPEESAAVATFETAEQSVGEKKEEKKKRGFFSFGK